MNTNGYDVAIIGAGHNGLICGAYLARAGLSVILIERRHETGGGLDTLEHAGFKFNTHAIYHMMAEVMPAWRDFDLPGAGVRYIFPKVQAAYIAKGIKPVVFYREPEKTAAYIADVFSGEAGGAYLRMYRDFEAFSERLLMPLTYVPPLPALDMVRQLADAADGIGERFNAIADKTALDILDAYGLDEPVRAAVLNLFTMWGLSPYEAIGYLFPLYVYRMTNAALCAGGSHRLSSALLKRFVQAGGTVADNAEAVRVLLTNGKVSGVLVADGHEIKASAVVSTVDPKQSFLRFFEPDEIPRQLGMAAERWQWEKQTFFGLHLALREAPVYPDASDIPDAREAMTTFLGIRNTEQLLDQMDGLEDGRLSKHPLGHITCPSLFDPIQTFPGFQTGRWECLVPFNSDWEEIKNEYAAQCLDIWKSYAPNIDPLFSLVYPPTYIEKKMTNMVAGSFKHGDYIPLQMGYFRPNDACSRVYTPISGFYVCGASTYPGGMILGAGGYIGANVIAEDFGIGKWWEEPEMIRRARADGLIPEEG